MSQFTDQLGITMELTSIPKRIVSLVPSQTELLHDLGLDTEVVGITKFCVHPQCWFKNKTRIGGTKQIHFDKIRLLQPDLIIANKEENVKEQVEVLRSIAPVWVSDVNNLQDAVSMIRSVGEMVNRIQQAAVIIDNIEQRFARLQLNMVQPAAYLIWKDPYMTVGGDTFISDMMRRAGFSNVFQSSNRYPEITIDRLQSSGCRVILLSSEPYPFGEQHVQEFSALLPGKKIILADGEMFSWYGSRLQEAASYFESLNISLR